MILLLEQKLFMNSLYEGEDIAFSQYYTYEYCRYFGRSCLDGSEKDVQWSCIFLCHIKFPGIDIQFVLGNDLWRVRGCYIHRIMDLYSKKEKKLKSR